MKLATFNCGFEISITCPKCKSTFQIDLNADAEDEQCPKCLYRFEPDKLTVTKKRSTLNN